jgi:hypothetical protein
MPDFHNTKKVSVCKLHSGPPEAGAKTLLKGSSGITHNFDQIDEPIYLHSIVTLLVPRGHTSEVGFNMGIQLQEQPESNMHTIIIDIFIRSTL